jgi:hypothetical protein
MRLVKDLTKKEIEAYIEEYERSWTTRKGLKDKETFEKIHNAIKNNGWLTSEQLYEAARWKTSRVSKIVKNNPDSIVKSITALALRIPNEKYKIRLLCSLDGISVPRASAILTMSNPQKYGAIDVNAWLALKGKKKQGFSDRDWIWYLKQIGKLANRHEKTPRQIDMASMKHGQKLMKTLKVR